MFVNVSGLGLVSCRFSLVTEPTHVAVFDSLKEISRDKGAGSAGRKRGVIVRWGATSI